LVCACCVWRWSARGAWCSAWCGVRAVRRCAGGVPLLHAISFIFFRCFYFHAAISLIFRQPSWCHCLIMPLLPLFRHYVILATLFWCRHAVTVDAEAFWYLATIYWWCHIDWCRHLHLPYHAICFAMIDVSLYAAVTPLCWLLMPWYFAATPCRRFSPRYAYFQPPRFRRWCHCLMLMHLFTPFTLSIRFCFHAALRIWAYLPSDFTIFALSRLHCIFRLRCPFIFAPLCAELMRAWSPDTASDTPCHLRLSLHRFPPLPYRLRFDAFTLHSPAISSFAFIFILRLFFFMPDLSLMLMFSCCHAYVYSFLMLWCSFTPLLRCLCAMMPCRHDFFFLLLLIYAMLIALFSLRPRCFAERQTMPFDYFIYLFHFDASLMLWFLRRWLFSPPSLHFSLSASSLWWCWCFLMLSPCFAAAAADARLRRCRWCLFTLCWYVMLTPLMMPRQHSTLLPLFFFRWCYFSPLSAYAAADDATRCHYLRHAIYFLMLIYWFSLHFRRYYYAMIAADIDFLMAFAYAIFAWCYFMMPRAAEPSPFTLIFLFLMLFISLLPCWCCLCAYIIYFHISRYFRRWCRRRHFIDAPPVFATMPLITPSPYAADALRLPMPAAMMMPLIAAFWYFLDWYLILMRFSPLIIFHWCRHADALMPLMHCWCWLFSLPPLSDADVIFFFAFLWCRWLPPSPMFTPFACHLFPFGCHWYAFHAMDFYADAYMPIFSLLRRRHFLIYAFAMLWCSRCRWCRRYYADADAAMRLSSSAIFRRRCRISSPPPPPCFSFAGDAASWCFDFRAAAFPPPPPCAFRCLIFFCHYADDAAAFAFSPLSHAIFFAYFFSITLSAAMPLMLPMPDAVDAICRYICILRRLLCHADSAFADAMSFAERWCFHLFSFAAIYYFRHYFFDFFDAAIDALITPLIADAAYCRHCCCFSLMLITFVIYERCFSPLSAAAAASAAAESFLQITRHLRCRFSLMFAAFAADVDISPRFAAFHAATMLCWADGVSLSFYLIGLLSIFITITSLISFDDVDAGWYFITPFLPLILLWYLYFRHFAPLS